MTTERLKNEAAPAAEWVQKHWSGRPRFGIVLGTGAGEVAKAIAPEHVFPYSQIPNFPQSTAIGHAGNLICGKLNGHDVVAMQGRFHLYEGYPVEQSTIGIELMSQLGIEQLFVTNAAGGINPQYQSGDIMLINSHLDLMFRHSQPRQRWHHSRQPQSRIDLAYCPALIQQGMACARHHGFPLYQGVYVAMLGPNYETRAEYRALRMLGGDTVGMSTVPEVAVAAHNNIKVLAMSIVTNVAKPDVLDPTSGEEVVAFADVAAPKIRLLIENAIAPSHTS
jgi:purine-nucleoside phosphorylase